MSDPASVASRLTGEPARSVRRVGTFPLVELGGAAAGRLAVLKSSADQPGQVASEVAGLRWLAESGAVPVPTVFGHDEDWLLLEYLPPAVGDRAAATRFGHGLARLHAAGAEAFGAAPPGGTARAWIGLAPMSNVAAANWPDWYVTHRVLPYLRTASDSGALDAGEVSEVEAACARLRAHPEAAGAPVSPARLHGDLWSGNLCWSAGRDGAAPEGWLIDPAAHGGHPETDLAMLALFGCPHHDAVLAGYQQISPLAEGWRARVGLHQLFPLLVHAALFGNGYAGQAVSAARSVA